MQDQNKTKAQLIAELQLLRRRVARLETARARGRQATEALRQAREGLEATLNALPDLLFEVDSSGRIYHFRAPRPELLYTSPSEFLGKTMSEVLPAEAGRVITEAIAQVVQHGRHSQAVYALHTPAGPGWFELSVAARGDPKTPDGRLIMLVRDITARKRAEEMLQRRAAQLALLNEVGSKIAMLLDVASVLDNAASLIQASFGYHHVALFTLDAARSELVMRAKAGSFVHLFPSGHRLKLGQGMVGWAGQHGERALANDVSVEPRYVNLYPHVILTRSELSVPIRVGQEVVGVLDVQSPQRDAFDENDVRVLETLADQVAIAIENARLYGTVQHELTERKLAEAAQRQSEELLKAQFENSPDLILIIDRDYRIITINRILAGDFTVEGLKGADSIGTLPLEHQEQVRQMINQCFETGQTREIEHSIGEGKWVQARIVPLKQDGMVTRALILSTDITERKKAEEQIKASLAEKDVLLKEVHHRVKNNLQVIYSLLNLQAGHIQDPSALRAFRESQDRVRSMALIHEKLYQSSDLARIDFGDYVQKLIAHLHRSCQTGAGSVAIEVDVGNIPLGIDTAIPCGLLINELVSNSLKHAFPHQAHREGEADQARQVRVALGAEGGQLVLVVRDNGVGFPPDVDFRAADSLGLQLVVALVQQLGGEIELDRQQGTTWKITFAERR